MIQKILDHIEAQPPPNKPVPIKRIADAKEVSDRFHKLISAAGLYRLKILVDLSLIVLSQGEEPRAYPEYGLTLEQAIAQREAWNILQLELTHLSSRGQRFIATKSGHVIQLKQPELMIEKVNDLVTQLRGPGT
jgi:hypothetical protein